MTIFDDAFDYLLEYSTAIIHFLDPPSPPQFIVEQTITAIPPLKVNSGSLLFVGADSLVYGSIATDAESTAASVFIEGGVIGTVGLSGHSESGHHVEVGENGFVRGPAMAVGIAGGDALVINEGAISGSAGVTLFGSPNGQVTNTGSIMGQHFGVLLDGGMGPLEEGSAVSNSGKIEGAIGIEILRTTAEVTNLGTIIGHGGSIGSAKLGAYAIDGTEANAGMVVNNAGSLVGQVTALVGSRFADKVVNSGSILGDVDLGNGNDEYRGQTGSVDGVVKGRAGNDILFGGTGDDILKGGKGSDVLWGNKGDDALWGGAGRDLFVFKQGDGHDTVVDFQNGVDSLDLTSLHFNNFAEVSAVAREITGGIINGVLLDMVDHGGGTIFLAEVTMAQFDRGDVIL